MREYVPLFQEKIGCLSVCWHRCICKWKKLTTLHSPTTIKINRNSNQKTCQENVFLSKAGYGPSSLMMVHPLLMFSSFHFEEIHKKKKGKNLFSHDYYFVHQSVKLIFDGFVIGKNYSRVKQPNNQKDRQCFWCIRFRRWPVQCRLPCITLPSMW